MADAIHDFTAKLRQPSLAPHVDAYVRWRRAVRAARERGEPVPSAPDLAPISINLDLTTACNFRCDHCIDWDILNTRNNHEEEVLKNSLREMREILSNRTYLRHVVEDLSEADATTSS